jgi:hypothetical protein
MKHPPSNVVYQSRAAPVDTSKDGQHPVSLTVYSHCRPFATSGPFERSVTRQEVG